MDEKMIENEGVPQANIKYPFSTTFLDYPDNESQAIMLFIMGCGRNCQGCHNPEFKNPEYSDTGIMKITAEQCSELLVAECKRNLTNKVVLTGGDPLYHANLEFTKRVLEILDSKEIKVVLYTAEPWLMVKKLGVTGYEYVKCGEYLPKYKQEQVKTDSYFSLASKNQEIWNRFDNLLTKQGVMSFEE